MHKKFLYVAVSLVLCMSAGGVAQISKQLGVCAGLSMYSLTSKQYAASTSFDSKTGFVAGVVLDISLLNFVSIEPGLVYSTRNSSYTVFSPFFNLLMTIENDLTYLAIPIHAKVRWPGMPVFKPYALAGVNVGFLLSATSPGSDSTDGKPAVNLLDLGLDFGAGLEFDLPLFVPYLEFVYDVGMTNISAITAPDESVKLNGSEIKAGIRLKL